MANDFGHYEVLGEIGRGGMGIVYRARDKRDGRTVAIKQLVFANIDPTKEQEFRDRFRREAATAARLRHPNIVTVHEVCMDDPQNYFYVMELLDGHSLRYELDKKGGRLTAKEWWHIFEQVADGLSFAHSFNVVHRDVKPDNIFLLKNDTVKITDFGIARAADYEETQLTKTGVMMGTLAYVSPEQLQDAKNVDHRADIFSLGVVSYEALSGEVPFTGDGIAQTIVKIVSQEEKPLHIVIPLIDVRVSAAISKALRKRARDRYRTIKDFCKEYELALAESDQKSHYAAASKATGAKSTPAPGAKPAPAPPPSPAPATPPGSTNELSLVDRVKAMKNLDVLRAGGTPAELNKPSMVEEAKQSAKTAQAHKAPEYQPIKPLHIFDTQGKAQTKMIEPAVICYRSGKLALADTATRKIHLFSYDGRWTGDCTFRESTESKTKGGSLTKPSGLAIDVRGRIYACDSSDPYMRIYDSRGYFLREFCNIQGKEGGIQGITLDSTGLIYVSDMQNACIQVFREDLGVWMRKIGGQGEQNGSLSLPAGLAVDRINQIYCVDYGSSRIVIFNRQGNFVRAFGGKGTQHGTFNVPRAVAVDNNDKIYVLDSLNHRIQVFGPTGDWQYSFGGRGTEPGKFIGPSDFSIDPANNLIYVADKGNQRIQVFELCQT